MHPLVKALLSQWEWRLEIVAVLLTLGALYTLGWLRLRRQSKRRQLASWLRLLSYHAGLAILAVSLLSPIDRLGGQLFFMHMLQHMLSIMLAAPLLLLANPFPFMVWALPATWRLRVAGLFARPSAFRRALAAVTRPFIAWLVFLTIYLGWHDASLYNLALRNDWIHDIQHITFFGAAMLFWWHVIGAAPHIHGKRSGWASMAYLIGVIPPNMAVAVTIAFASNVIYTYYLSAPRIWGFTALEDQMISGAIMWIPGSMMFLLAALIILARMFTSKEPLPVKPDGWDADDKFIAPGLEHRVVQNRWKQLKAANSHGADAS
jgi:cytochrome c oxidase assembly factor CtaG